MDRHLRQLHPARVKRATVADALSVAQNLREADRRELLAAVGPKDPRDILVEGVLSSDFAVTVAGREPAAIFGVRRVADSAIVWGLAATEAERRTRDWVELAPFLRSAIVDAAGGVPLWNVVDERNTLHHRWLRWIGAEFTGRSVARFDPSVSFLEFVIHV